MALNLLYISAFLFTLRAMTFNLYPTVDPDNLAKYFGISIDCLDALNETVTCDQTLFQMSSTVDNYLWTTENVTDLCTTTCLASTAKWWSDVQGRCDIDNIAAYGKMIPAESIVGRFSDGLNIACLQSNSSSKISGPYANTSLGSPVSGPYSNSSSVSTGSAPYSNASSTANTTSSASSWCLIESQDWVGSDIIRPNCSTDSTDPSCHDPTDVSPQNERIANLYPNEMLCSDCFIKMFHQRMSSPYLPDSDHSDYLVAQYQDILDVCKANMPELIVRSLPFYGDAPVAYSAISSGSPTLPPFSSNRTQYTNQSWQPFTNSNTTTCTGQTIRTEDMQGPAFSNSNASFCDALSKKYGVTTGDLETVLDNPWCLPTYSAYCVPAACTLMTVPNGATCDSIASSNSITTLQFSNWNPNINGLCDNLQEGDYVCIGAPGGSYIPPPVSNKTQSAGAYQRGGEGASDTGALSNSTAPFSNSTNKTTPPPSASPSSGAAAPSPTQKGISASCTTYGQARKGDYCSTFAQEHKITPSQLYALNGALGDGGKKCDTAFWSGYYYCVGTNEPSVAGGGSNATATTVAMSTVMSTVISTIGATPPSSVPSDPNSTPPTANIPAAANPTPTPPTANSPASPSPTQPGFASPCAKYAQAHTGDTCSTFATANQITAADLYSRNSALGSQGENCGTAFWGGYYYCVGGTD